MIGARYRCGSEARRNAIAARSADDTPLFTGIDYIEVNVDLQTTPTPPVTIDIVLLNGLPADALTDANVRIEGGVRYPAPRVESVLQKGGPDDHGRYGTFCVTLRQGDLTDFSIYTLRLVTSATNAVPPAMIDGRLSDVEFSFKIDCPSDFDCREAPTGGGSAGIDGQFDYAARDYAAFWRLLLDRVTSLVPGFRDDTPVDLTITLAEALAYAADHKSYRLDWIGTESFLSTARSPASLRRHARLLDYRVSEGVSARTFIFAAFTPGSGPAADGMTLDSATPVTTRIDDMPDVLSPDQYRRVLALRPLAFETVAEKRLWRWQNEIAFHTWNDDFCALEAGACSATLVDGSAGDPDAALKPGDFLLLAETRDPAKLDAPNARKERRHIVRLTDVRAATDLLAPSTLRLVDVAWGAADALPFQLVLQARRADAIAGSAGDVCAVARGNLVLADHGYSLPPAPALGVSLAEQLAPRLVPPSPPTRGAWRPQIDRPGLARIDPVDLTAQPATAVAALRTPRATKAVPALSLLDDFSIWDCVPDLLDSGRFSRDFVVERSISGRETLRFGDGVNGQPPSPESVFEVNGRFANMSEGNIGADAIAHVVLPIAKNSARIQVSNPLPALGGAAPQTAASIRAEAPEAFRIQERAVTAADYAEVARRHPQVSNAHAVIRWTGSWRTVFVHVDREGGLPVDKDPAFKADMLSHIERYRLMGLDVAIRGARSVALDIELEICVAAGYLRSDVARAVRAVLSTGTNANRGRGFFHPDNFTFGTTLYLSRLVATVMCVPGVRSALPLRFQRFAEQDRGELAAGAIHAAGAEILRLDNDPNYPENGRLSLHMTGGA